MNLTDSFERLFLLLNIMHGRTTPFTISSAAEQLTVPVEVIRDDIACVLYSPIFGDVISIERSKIHFYPGEDMKDDGFYDDDEEDSDEIYSIYFSDILENTKAELKKEIIKGLHDDTEIYSEFSPINKYIFPINRNEINAINRFFPGFIDSSKSFYIKGMSKELSQNQLDILQNIEQAIYDKTGIKVVLKPSEQTDIEEFTFIPRWIFHNTEFNFIYIFGNEHIVRLDNIKDIRFVLDYNEAENISPRFEYMWGVGVKDDEIPTDVKIKILNITPNLLDKIKDDTRNRIHGHLDEENLIYTDTILGMDAFRRWLRGYGASMMVLEPVSLARQMYESAKLVLNNYDY